ncbi:MAG: DUF4143 domain-containing protein, partial [Muribaculaceae bacterium]|nr:DUF4143 domain-containing protein [Muribaculaceae bacterium]
LCDIYFYRENSGREVDIIEETAEGLNIYEVKAGATFQTDFTKNLKYLQKLIPEVRTTTVIYNGQTNGRNLLNIRDI